MPPRTKPHPRSLDALFPRPKIKRCPRGHSQAPKWKATHGCMTCDRDGERRAEAERLRSGAGQAEREEWSGQLGPIPDVLEIRVVQSGKVLRFPIPRALQLQAKRRRARSQRGRARI